jgi:hypothetical protein
MSDGTNGGLKHSKTTDIKMKELSQVTKISLYWYDIGDPCVGGCRFYDKNTQILLEFGTCFDSPPFEILLNEGERVIGIKSRLYDKSSNPRHEDPQFIIGRLE